MEKKLFKFAGEILVLGKTNHCRSEGGPRNRGENIENENIDSIGDGW